jgi:hypothetical protein
MIAAGANPLLTHRWGVTRADRVWAEIAGIAPSTRPWERAFVILQAFIDDSYTAKGTFVLGGYIANAEAWARFSAEWEAALPKALRKADGRYYFKMSDMAGRGRLADVPQFVKIIEDHVAFSLA